jgi:catechol 2,3-dioxygenase-like lactoylglutathione lyase family enzyme
MLTASSPSASARAMPVSTTRATLRPGRRPRGLEVLPPDLRERHADGTIVAFVVDDLEAERSRLAGEGVAFAGPIREEPWGERLLLLTDPNGVVYELVEWATASR